MEAGNQRTLNGDLFTAYVDQMLASEMRPGQPLFIDNLSSHSVKGALDPFIDKGVQVIFLPTYALDFNLIEQAWSKMKAYLRKVEARSFEDFIHTFSDAFDTITTQDIQSWISHCSYFLSKVKLLYLKIMGGVSSETCYFSGRR